MATKKKEAKTINTSEDREKALSEALAQIQKQFGKGAVMKLGDDNPMMNIEAISTGSMSLDLATGIGGVPRGRIIEVFGPESSGKTTLTLHVIAEVQKTGGRAAFIDAEHALQPDYGEQALEIAEMLVRSGAIDLVVVDSVAALVPKHEIEGAMGDSAVGLQARLMSQALRKLAGIINKTNTTIIFINQLREKIGVMYGSSETTTGGRALKFFSSMRLDVRRIESIKSGDTVLGNRTKVKIVKNKVAPPFKQAEFDIMYGKGISKTGDVIDCAVEAKVIDKAGSWYSFDGNRIGQGRENVKKYMEDNPEIFEQVEQLLLDSLKQKDEKKNDDEAADIPGIDDGEIFIDEDGVIIE